MAKKVDVDLVAEIMQKNHLDPVVQRRILEELLGTLQEESGLKEPAEKKQFVVLVSDPEGKLKGLDFVAWVLQIPAEDSVATTPDRIFRAAYDFNASKRGRLLPVNTVGEALENIPVKFFKEADCWEKTKEPVLVVTTDNKVPIVATE